MMEGADRSPAKLQERANRFASVTKQTKRSEPLSLQINQTLVSCYRVSETSRICGMLNSTEL